MKLWNSSRFMFEVWPSVNLVLYNKCVTILNSDWVSEHASDVIKRMLYIHTYSCTHTHTHTNIHSYTHRYLCKSYNYQYRPLTGQLTENILRSFLGSSVQTIYEQDAGSYIQNSLQFVLSHNTARVLKSWKTRWAEDVARVVNKCMQTSVGKPGRKASLMGD
jgi:hypothetical protein